MSAPMLELSTLEDRLGKLERENHWLRLWLAALGLGLVALVVAAAAASDFWNSASTEV